MSWVDSRVIIHFDDSNKLFVFSNLTFDVLNFIRDGPILKLNFIGFYFNLNHSFSQVEVDEGCSQEHS